MVSPIRSSINRLKARLDIVEEELAKLKASPPQQQIVYKREVIAPSTTLPDHLRQTYDVLQMLRTDMTAEEVGEHTKRERAVESNYLNVLVIMGICTKRHVSRKVYFTLN
jgi:hypothetical protein